MAAQPPPSWYPDPERPGFWRYWNGHTWTEHRAPMRGVPAPPSVEQAAPVAAPQRRGWVRRHKVLTALAVVLLLFIGAGALGSEPPPPEPTTAEASADPTPSPSDVRAAEDEGQPVVAPKSEQDTDRLDKKPDPRPKARRLHQVLRVIDGDTVEIAFQGRPTTVRVIGIDTPETVSPSVPDECGGPAATATARQLLEGERVTMRFDPSQGRRDRFGRLLASLTIPGTGDFGLAMIRRGRAAEYTYDSGYRMQSRYEAAEARARTADKNMWGTCGGPDTPLVPKPKPRPKPQAPSRPSNCAPGYQPCIPNSPTDLDCADVSGPITVTGNDQYGLDREGDKLACES